VQRIQGTADRRPVVIVTTAADEEFHDLILVPQKPISKNSS
jgi:hypothetical protein